MATQFLQATPGNFNFSPTIIPPSPGDLEEARIRRLMDTAKLRNLSLEPLQQQRMFELQKVGLDETKGFHQSQVADMASGRNLEARGQDIAMRGQDLTADEHKATLHSATVNNILAHAISRPDIPLSVYADTAKRFGFPEVGDSFAAAHDTEQTTKANTLATNLITTFNSGKTNDYLDTLKTLSALPDAEDLLPRIKSTVQEKYPNIAKDLDPTKPGIQTTTSGDYNDPEIAAALLRQREQQRLETEQVAKVNKASGRFQLRKRLGLEEGYDPTKSYPGYLH